MKRAKMHFFIFAASVITFLLSHLDSATGCNNCLAPKIIQAPKPHRVAQGEIVSFFCWVSGIPKPSISWKKDDRRIRFKPRLLKSIKVYNETTHISVLRIEKTKARRDNGTYTCVATNDLGEARADVELYIYPKRTGVIPKGFPVINNTLEVLTEEERRNVKLKCDSKGDPKPSVRWLKDYFPMDVNNDPRIQIMESGYLLIRNSKRSDEGTYECVAENIWGVAYSNKSTLYIKIRRIFPRFLTVSDDQRVQPGSDVNLKCLVSGSPRPYVRWRQGAKYLTVEDDSQNELILNDVRQSENYTCEAFSNLGKISHTVQVIVRVLPPQNVKVIRTSSTSIFVMWDKLKIPVSGYEVLYTTFDSRASANWSRLEVGSSNVAEINNLNPEFKYRVKVRTKSLDGSYGNLSEIVISSLEKDKDYFLEMYELNSISVMWDELKIPVSGYEVFYTTFDSRASENWSRLEVGFSNVAEINNLNPEFKYRVKVRAISLDGRTGNLSEIIISSLEDDKGILPPQNVKVIRTSPSSISVTWYELNISVSGYDVFYNMFASPDLTYWSRLEVGSSTAAEINNLNPKYTYAVRVRAKSLDGRTGNLSEPVTSSLKEDRVLPAPQNVKARRTSSSSISVMWDELNIPVSGFEVFYNLHFFTSSTAAWELLEVGPTAVVEINNLKPDTNYGVRVRAKSFDGKYGNFSEIIISSLEDDKVPPPPQNVKARRATSSSITVMWDKLNITVSGYEVFYKKFATSSMASWNKVEVGSSNDAVITNLEPKATYAVGVRAKASSGIFGKFSALVITSLADVKALPAPQNVKVRRTSSSSISVMWDELNIPVSGFEVFYNMHFFTSSMAAWERLAVGPTAVVVINNLKPDTNYAVRVRAKSFDGKFGNFSEIVISSFKDDKVPPPPQNVKARRATSSSITVMWDKLNITVSGYEVFYKKFATSSMASWNKVEVGSSTEAEIANLEPKTTYAVRVRAKASSGIFGNFSTLVITSLDGVKALPEVKIIGKDTFQLKLKKASEKEGVIRHYHLVVVPNNASGMKLQDYTKEEVWLLLSPSDSYSKEGFTYEYIDKDNITLSDVFKLVGK